MVTREGLKKHLEMIRKEMDNCKDDNAMHYLLGDYTTTRIFLGFLDRIERENLMGDKTETIINGALY